MPPVGAPDTQAPQGPPPPISVGSEASKLAAEAWHGSNEKPLAQNVPAQGDQLTPQEEVIPTDVMPGAVSVPVVSPTAAPAPVDAGFAPAPIESAGDSSMTAAMPTATEAPANPPTPNWEAMANSTKAGVEPTTPNAESPTATAYGELDQSNLDKEVAGDPEMKALYEYVAQDPDAMLAILQGAMKEDNAEKRSDKLRAIAPLLKSWLDKNISPR